MTRASGFIFLGLRLIFVVFCVVTSICCVLAFIPFTYQQIFEAQVVPWTVTFVRFHPWMYWIAFVSAAWTLAEDYRPGTRALVVGYLAAGAIAGAVLVAFPLLATIKNEPADLVWAAVWLMPLWWLAAIDIFGPGRRLTWSSAQTGEDWRLFWTAVIAGTASAVVYGVIHEVRFGAASGPAPAAPMPIGVGLWSWVLHVLAFLAVFAAFACIRAIASLTRRPALAEFVLAATSGAALLTVVNQSLVFSAVSLVGREGLATAALFAVTLVLASSGQALRLARASEPVRSGIALAMRPLDIGFEAPVLLRLALLCGWGALAYWLAVATSLMDWNYLIQTLAVLLIWTLGFVWIYGVVGRGPDRGFAVLAVFVLPLLVIAGYRTLASTPDLLVPLGLAAPTRSAVLDRYANYNVSFRVLRSLTRVEPARASTLDMGQFYALLQRHTNIPRTVKIDVPDVSIAPGNAAPSRRHPHVFVIVIDSLRQDYLSPYNRSVSFTPAIARFATESTVFRNAFTHYGATGLSEPSIWTGSLVPHQQYPAPFGPMNTLQKLLLAQPYQAYVSVDSVLRSILAPWPGLIELDNNVATKDYDLCRSLGELTSKLQSRKPSDPQPVFAYTQPQNIHVSTITRDGASVPAGQSYAGFYPPCAARIQQLDSCFGTFLDSLKQLGLYDDSVVVLTSDHGDSLGEEGRWGHAYTIYPEIVRIPLIVHLPSWLRGLSVDPDEMTFSTDITPSLYYLLGQRPTLNHALFGRPLFTERREERAPYLRDHYVVASSYGPVYGVISDRGRALYIADATSYRDYVFDLTTGIAGTSLPVSDAAREAGVRRIRDIIAELTRFYRLPITP